jgi:hypothetical protein
MQILQNKQSTLDVSALAFAMGGINVFDASVSCWKTKYTYCQVRPITYIHNVLGHAAWLPLLTTPAHPEYPSAHATLSAANAEAMTAVFGDNQPFTDHTYDYFGWPSRDYASYRAIGEEAGNSRIPAGIHYQQSVDTGMVQGKKVFANITANLKFSKGN